jgi:hypothetical protein
MDFFFEDMAVGYFEGSRLPTEDGRYRYMAYRGPGHAEMWSALYAAGRAECWYPVDGGQVSFSLFRSPESEVLELRDFKHLEGAFNQRGGGKV